MKGLDPLIAEITLAIIIITMATILLVHQSGFLRQTQFAAEPTFNCAFGRAAITDAIVTGDVTNVIIRNMGRIPLDITARLIDVDGMEQPAITTLPIAVGEGKIASISFDSSGMSCEEFGQVLVFSNCPEVRPIFEGPATCT